MVTGRSRRAANTYSMPLRTGRRCTFRAYGDRSGRGGDAVGQVGGSIVHIGAHELSTLCKQIVERGILSAVPVVHNRQCRSTMPARTCPRSGAPLDRASGSGIRTANRVADPRAVQRS